MTNLVPRAFFDFPRFPSLWDEEEDFWSMSSLPAGLSVSEDEKYVYVEAQVPGVSPEKIEVTYDKGMLWVKGQQDQEEKNKKYYRRAASSFSYHIRLPDSASQAHEPKATCKDGVMKIVFEKTPEVQPKKIQVSAE